MLLENLYPLPYEINHEMLDEDENTIWLDYKCLYSQMLDGEKDDKDDPESHDAWDKYDQRMDAYKGSVRLVPMKTRHASGNRMKRCGQARRLSNQ